MLRLTSKVIPEEVLDHMKVSETYVLNGKLLTNMTRFDYTTRIVQ